MSDSLQDRRDRKGKVEKMPALTALCLVAGLMAASSGFARDSEIVRPSDSFEFSYEIKLPEISGNGRLWVPLATSGQFQDVELVGVDAPREPERTRDEEYGNRVLTFPVKEGDGGESIKLRYRVVREEKPPYPVAEGADLSKYLQAARLIPLNDTFRDIAMEATEGAETNLEKGRALYDHVVQRMQYGKDGEGWGKGDAVYACNAQTGNCTDFHSYFIGLARSLDVPARFAIGFTIPADRDSGEIPGYHCWAEFYADGEWVPVDISEAWKEPDLADYYFGHHPANRFELTIGRDLIVDPEPTSGPINMFVYPLLEVEGQKVAVQTVFQFRRIAEQLGS